MLAEAAVAEQDDGVFLFNHVVWALLVFFHDAARGDYFVVEDEQERGKQHGEGNHQRDAVGHGARQNMALAGDGKQHKAEFTGLRQAEREQFAAHARQAEQQAEDKEDGAFYRQRGQGDGGHHPKFFIQQGKIHARAHGNEE